MVVIVAAKANCLIRNSVVNGPVNYVTVFICVIHAIGGCVPSPCLTGRDLETEGEEVKELFNEI